MNETIRTYTISDMARAATVFDGARERDVSPVATVHAYNGRPGIRRLQTDVLATADRMYEEHGEWFDTKFAPLLSYLQADESHRTSKTAIKRHYQKGLGLATAYASLGTDHRIDTQDVITAYTGRFIQMVRVCEQAGALPESALLIAEQAFRLENTEVFSVFKNNPDISKRAVERSLTYTASPIRRKIFLEDYRRNSQAFERLRADERYKHIDSDTLLGSLTSSVSPEEAQEVRQQIDTSRLSDVPAAGDFIEGVPELRQKQQNWCGYTSLAMVLQYYGYNDLTPEKLFEHEFGYYDRVLEKMDSSEGPTADTLALIATELTPLKARIITTSDYKKLKERNPSLQTPQDVLRTFLKKHVPAIIRVPKHFVVVRGYDPEEQSYSINDPLNGKRETTPERKFQRIWEKDDPMGYQRDARHLMLILTPPKAA